MKLVYSPHEQGTPEWLADRMGVITGSEFATCRERKKNGEPTAKAILYAQNKARERAGGTVLSGYQNAAMRLGNEYELPMVQAYERSQGVLVDRIGFVYTADRRFGVSPDGLVGDAGMIEVKALIGSDNLFTVLVGRDYSEFIDQILGNMWLLDRAWCDLLLGVPDLREEPVIVRIERDEPKIAALAHDLNEFEKTVCDYERALRARLLEV